MYIGYLVDFFSFKFYDGSVFVSISSFEPNHHCGEFIPINDAILILILMGKKISYSIISNFSISNINQDILEFVLIDVAIFIKIIYLESFNQRWSFSW